MPTRSPSGGGVTAADRSTSEAGPPGSSDAPLLLEDVTAPTTPSSNARELARWAHRQGSHIQPRLTTALALAGVLPPYTLDWLRLGILRAGGLRIGPRSGVGGRVWIAGGTACASRIEIGADCFLNDGCRFDVSAPVTIGDGVFLGHEVALLTATHEIGDKWRRAGWMVAEPIHIERGSWIGARAMILSGVTVGAGAVVAAGAVVTRPVPPSTLVGGVPARVIRTLGD